MNIYVFVLLAAVWLYSVRFLKKYRVWLFYYIVATVGLARGEAATITAEAEGRDVQDNPAPPPAGLAVTPAASPRS